MIAAIKRFWGRRRDRFRHLVLEWFGVMRILGGLNEVNVDTLRRQMEIRSDLQKQINDLAAALIAMKPTTTKFERDQKVREESAVFDPHMGTM